MGMGCGGNGGRERRAEAEERGGEGADHDDVLDAAQAAPGWVEIVAGDHERGREAERLLVEHRKVFEHVERVGIRLVFVLALRVDREQWQRPGFWLLLVSAVFALDELLHLDLLLALLLDLCPRPPTPLKPKL